MLIPLSMGQWALVSSDDFAWLSQWKWMAWWNEHTRSYYAVRHGSTREGRGTVYMHRQVLQLKRGDGIRGDHRDGDTLNNQRLNLRVASRSQNACNSRRSSKNTTGYKGVSRAKFGKFNAQITVHKKTIHLGTFSTPGAAHAAYCLAAIKYHGEFARVA